MKIQLGYIGNIEMQMFGPFGKKLLTTHASSKIMYFLNAQ